jgi:hypothetical protein
MAKRFLVNIDLDNNKIVNLADPSSATDAANKQYVDNVARGLSWKQGVRVATTTNGTLASAYENGDSVDGVTLATGDRILIKDQSSASENGIYTVNASGAPTRAVDADSAAELNFATVSVALGTVNANKVFYQYEEVATVNTDAVNFSELGAGGSSYTAGDGLTLTGSDFDVNVGAGLEISSDAIRIAAAAAGNGLTGGAGSALAVGAGDGISVAADAVSLASSTAGAGLTYTTGVLAVGAGDGITANANDVAVDSTVSRRFSTGTHASSTSVTITHSLGVQFCSGVSVYVTSTGEKVECDITATSTTQMTFAFASAPGANTLTFSICT